LPVSDLDFWHRRYTQQSRWTADLRTYLVEQYGLISTDLILEVGCGTGVIASDMQQRTGAAILGVDKDFSALRFASRHVPGPKWIQARGEHLPFSSNSFQVVYCHFLFLWAADPLSILIEMRRVTRTGGVIIAMAEPDYTEREVHPDSLKRLSRLQQNSILTQGARPDMGGQLAPLFHQAGLHRIESGVIRHDPDRRLERSEWEAEWQTLKSDLLCISPDEDLTKDHQIFMEAGRDPRCSFYTPTWYAIGNVP
jgi:SAM-dependent methyltransferase